MLLPTAFCQKLHTTLKKYQFQIMLSSRHEQYDWMGYWYWANWGSFRQIGIGIAKAQSEHWYRYWEWSGPIDGFLS